MSSVNSPTTEELHHRIKRIKDIVDRDDAERYVDFARDVLGVRLTDQQEQILHSLGDNQRTVIMSGNGPGKSFGVAIAKLAFLVANPGSIVLGTSGSYSQYTDAVWRPMKNIYKRQIMPLDGQFGEPNDSGQPSLELGPEWFAKVVSPRDPGDLEGRHGSDVLVVIEEADKAYITDDHFDSARSSVTSREDRMLAIANPPRDATNPVHSRLQSDKWHTIQFSTLNSHNVRVDAGELADEKIPGITDLHTVIEDWEEYNREEWPGIEAAREMSDPDSPDFREDLDERWYRRRAGVMPPTKAAAWRPIEPAHVNMAWERDHPDVATMSYDRRDTGEEVISPGMGTGVDVARSGADFTIAGTVLGDRFDIRFEEAGANHTAQRDAIQSAYADATSHPLAVDAIGEGSGLADMLAELFDGVLRFGNGKEPIDTGTYYSCWEEGLDLLGTWLANGGSIDDPDLRDELLVASRMVTFEEYHLASRGGEVAKATASKDDIKSRIGRSPDRLDAALMAVWARDSGADAGTPTASARVGEAKTDPRGGQGIVDIAKDISRRQQKARKGWKG